MNTRVPLNDDRDSAQIAVELNDLCYNEAIIENNGVKSANDNIVKKRSEFGTKSNSLDKSTYVKSNTVRYCHHHHHHSSWS